MEVEVLEKNENEVKFRVKGGSQSLLNVLRETANSKEGVTFSGVQLEHPLENSSIFILRTQSKDAMKVFKALIDETRKNLKELKEAFDETLK